jgi:protein-S-isoprenylcysteine O-methyltransferase Ste14
LCCLYYPFGFFTIYVNSGAASCLGFSDSEVPFQPYLAALAVWLWGWGMLLHFGSDCQKHYILHHCGRKGLITEGFFAHTRNPNYLGEVLIYSAYATLAQHWVPWALCGAVWFQLFIPNMLQKDRRMSRHPGWKEYAAETGLILPSPFRLASSFLCWVLADTREAMVNEQAGSSVDTGKVADEQPYQLASHQQDKVV